MDQRTDRLVEFDPLGDVKQWRGRSRRRPIERDRYRHPREQHRRRLVPGDVFAQRIEAFAGRAEELAAARGERWSELPLADQDRYYDLAKKETG